MYHMVVVYTLKSGKVEVQEVSNVHEYRHELSSAQREIQDPNSLVRYFDTMTKEEYDRQQSRKVL